MEKETIAPLLKNNLTESASKKDNEASGCCGGTPTDNADACCKLDEEKKAEGEEGCGCNTPKKSEKKTSCC
jgi:hypothetical protein